jgi:signal transduction histidine kinase
LQRIYQLFHHPSREKQPESTSRIIPQIERTVNKSTKYLRAGLLLALVWLVGVEITEFEFRVNDVFHSAEILIIIILLCTMGILIEVVSRTREIQPVHQRLNHLTTMLLQRIESSVTRFAKTFRVAIAMALVLLTGVETAEFEFRISDTFHIGEIIIYFILLGTLGLLVEVILQVHKKQQHSIDLLNYKHMMSLQLLSHHSWESLTGVMTKQLAEVVDARAAYLFLNQALTGQLEPISEWVSGKSATEQINEINCQVCPPENSSGMVKPHLSEISASPTSKDETRLYCFPIHYKENLYALFRFELKPGQGVTEEQQEVLSSISDEVIISLMAGRDRERLSELELAKTALAERHAMSHYLHDNLGQNLGYLRMKLEQFVNDPSLFYKDDELISELKIMRDVADESYRFVRNTLEVAIPDSTPLLTNYLNEHVKKVASRSHIEINFLNRGISRTVPIELQQAVFFVFQEALSNVEKHSRASHADVLVEWELDRLTITITDNGSGFNTGKVSDSKHFGLEIMRERMAGVGGSVMIKSTEGSGTSLKIIAPLSVGRKQPRTKQHESS